jgi:hypothetical protein
MKRLVFIDKGFTKSFSIALRDKEDFESFETYKELGVDRLKKAFPKNKTWEEVIKERIEANKNGKDWNIPYESSLEEKDIGIIAQIDDNLYLLDSVDKIDKELYNRFGFNTK